MKILGALFIVAGIILFAQYQIFPAFICIVIGAVFMGKPKEQREETEDPDESADSEIVRVDTPLQKVRSSHSDHRRLAFPVDGVTVNNDDGSSRQDILRALCEGEDMAVAEIWFDDYLFGGKLHIRVMSDQGCIGEIRQKDVTTVREYFGKAVRMIYGEITRDLLESGSEVYRADVVIIESAESTEQG